MTGQNGAGPKRLLPLLDLRPTTRTRGTSGLAKRRHSRTGAALCKSGRSRHEQEPVLANWELRYGL